MADEGKTFEMALKTAASLPMVRISRDDFLQRELSKYCSDEQVKCAIANNPAYAGIKLDIIDTIADNCINFETKKVSTISFVAGLPGGLAIIGAVPADMAQYLGHMLRILQKLVYLYGWDELIPEDGRLDDETTNMLVLFFGVMFGINSAVGTITKISASAAQRACKDLANKALTKTVLYPIIKKIATVLGIKMTKEIFAKGVSKIVPVVGGFVAGGITYISFKPCAERLQKHLRKLKWCDVNNYR